MSTSINQVALKQNDPCYCKKALNLLSCNEIQKKNLPFIENLEQLGKKVE
jgi:hypothetical protein